MRCDEHMNRFLELDNDGQLPLTTRLHLLFCPRCRHEINALTLELAILRDSAPQYADADRATHRGLELVAVEAELLEARAERGDRIEAERDRLLNQYFPQRTGVFLSQHPNRTGALQVPSQ